MELISDHIGKEAVLIHDFGSLLEGSHVIIRGCNVGSFNTEVVQEKAKWVRGKNSAHNCNGFFSDRIGWNVTARNLELVEEESMDECDIHKPVKSEEKLIETEYEIPTGI